MKVTSKAILLIAAVALGACTNANRFGGDDAVELNGTGAGDVNNPQSPAYFQQAIGDRVLFEVDQSTLTASAKATLNEQARWLQENSDFDAIIESHADEQGT